MSDFFQEFFKYIVINPGSTSEWLTLFVTSFGLIKVIDYFNLQSISFENGVDTDVTIDGVFSVKNISSLPIKILKIKQKLYRYSDFHRDICKETPFTLDKLFCVNTNSLPIGDEIEFHTDKILLPSQRVVISGSLTNLPGPYESESAWCTKTTINYSKANNRNQKELSVLHRNSGEIEPRGRWVEILRV